MVARVVGGCSAIDDPDHRVGGLRAEAARDALDRRYCVNGNDWRDRDA